MQQALLIMAAGVCVIGIAFLIHVLRKENQRERGHSGPQPLARIEARLEYDRSSGGLFYVIENLGQTLAHDVRVYLPRCHEIASGRNGQQSHRIAAGISKVTLQTYDLIGPNDCVEIPIVQLPPVEESARDVYGLGLDAELRWSNAHGDVTMLEHILPVGSRISRRERLPAHA